MQPQVDFVAHHPLLFAIPAFVPAIAVVGVILWVAMRDRRTPEDTDERNKNSE